MQRFGECNLRVLMPKKKERKEKKRKVKKSQSGEKKIRAYISGWDVFVCADADART